MTAIRTAWRERPSPDGARLLALADSWDVMTSERPYSRAMRPGEALEECRRCVGSQFFLEPVEILVSPTFERTLRIFANEQAARGGDESGLAHDAGQIFALRCECGPRVAQRGCMFRRASTARSAPTTGATSYATDTSFQRRTRPHHDSGVQRRGARLGTRANRGGQPCSTAAPHVDLSSERPALRPTHAAWS